MHPRTLTTLFGAFALGVATCANAAVNEWTETGPDAGWATGVVIHPTNGQIALLSTVRGVYRTTDGTAHWTLVNEAATGSDLAFDPSNPARVVQASEKIWMSLNGGQTFAQAQSPADGIRSVEIGANGVIYVASYQGTVFKSVDHGNTWTNCGAPWAQGAYLGALGIDPANYSTAGDQDRLFLQANDNSTSPGTSATWRTADGCATWTKSGAGDPAGTNNVVRRYVVSPTDANRVLASAYDGIYRSTNGGASWTRVLAAYSDWIEFDPKNPGYVAALSVFGRVMRSTNNGDTWDPLFGAELQVAGNASFAFDPQTTGRMIVSSSNGAYLSIDGGLYFNLRVTGLSATDIGDFSTADDGTIYAVFNPGAGGVFRRDPSTLAWSALNNDDLKQKASTNGFLMSLVATAPGNSARIYAGVWQANLSHSNDGGNNWQMRHPAFLGTSPATNLYDLAVDPDEELLAFAATDHGIWKTTDGGTTWATSNGSLPSYAKFVLPLRGSDVVFAISQDPNVAYSNAVYKSTDNGATWSTTGAMPALVAAGQLLSVAVDPQDANVVYAGHNGGVYKSINGGTTWNAMTFSGQAAPYATGVSVLIDPDYSTTLTLARSNENSGVVRTTDGGLHWERIAGPSGVAPNARILDRAVLDPLRPNVIIAGILGTNISEYEVGTDLELTVANLGAALPSSTSFVATFTVRNQGPHAASPSALTLTLPTWLTPTVPGVCTRTGQTLHCAIPPLWLNETFDVSLPLEVSASGGTGQFTAALATHEADTDPSNNNFSLAVSGSELANLVLGVAAGRPTLLDRGGSTTIVWSVSNDGPSPSTLTTLDVQLPAGLNVTGNSQTHGTCGTSAGVFHCELGTLIAGKTAIITINLLAATPGSRDIWAHADGAGSDNGILHDTFINLTVRPVGDVSVTLAESADPVDVGTSFTYTATVRNLSGDGSGVHVTVPFTGARFSLAASPGGTCTNTDAQVDCEITHLAAGASTTVDIHLRALTAGIATATATATHAGVDTDTTNNTVSIGTTMRLVGDVSVELAKSGDPIIVGGPLSYTATVRNLGPSSGAAHLAVELSGGTVAVVTPTNGTCTSASSSVECDFPALFSGDTTETVIIALTTTAAGTATATATVTFAGMDPVSTNNTASASTTVNAAPTPPPPPPPPAGGGNTGSSGSGSGGGGGGGRFDWPAIGLLGLLLAGRRLKTRRASLG